jgi:hypothetical protein
MSNRAISMPEQFGPSAGDTLFAMNRASYLRTAGAVGADDTKYNAIMNKKTKIYTSTLGVFIRSDIVRPTRL